MAGKWKCYFPPFLKYSRMVKMPMAGKWKCYFPPFLKYYESPSRWVDYDYSLKFCSNGLVENEDVAKRAKAVWYKIVTITEFWVGLPKSKQPGLSQRGKNSNYCHLCNCYKDPLVPVKLQFFEEIARYLNKFLLVFQTGKPMAAFLAETLEQLLHYFCSKFVKKDVMSKASTASKLTKIGLSDENNLVSVTNLDHGFGIKYTLKQLKSEKNHWSTSI